MKKNDSKNIIICGLGGQGVVSLGKVIADFYQKKGYEIKVSDVMGLGQRGGNVECHFRYSSKPIMSPFIKFGDADYIISFEQTETLRNMHYLKDGGVIVSSTFELSTPTVNIGIQKDIQEKKIDIKKNNASHVYRIDIKKYEHDGVDFSKMINIVLLSFFSNFIGYDDNEILDSIRSTVSSRYIQDNIKAYELGKKIFIDYL